MNDLNTVLIEGKLTHDPELSVISPSQSVCRFSIAVNRYFMDKTKKEYVENVSYFTVETWGAVAHNCARWLHKGRGVRVVGRLKQARWTDSRYENMPRERVYIVSEHIEFSPLKNKSADGTQPGILRPQIPEAETVDTTEAQASLDAEVAKETSATEK